VDFRLQRDAPRDIFYFVITPDLTKEQLLISLRHPRDGAERQERQGRAADEPSPEHGGDYNA